MQKTTRSIYVKCSQKANLHTESRFMVSRGWEQGLPINRHERSLMGGTKCSKTDLWQWLDH